MTNPLEQALTKTWENFSVSGKAPKTTEQKLIEVIKMALAHEYHEEGKCGCCWTLKAEAVIAEVEAQ